MKTLLRTMTIGLSHITGSHVIDVKSMDVEGENLIPQGQTARGLTSIKKKNAQKMMMINDALKRHEDSLKKEGDEVKDVSKGIGGKLHDLWANPVLDGELKYAGAPNPFKIRDLVKKDGTIDLSDPIFGEASKYLLITTDPIDFFNVVEKSFRVLILIAPKFLIEEITGSSTKQFEPIMTKWNVDHAPIGFFYRVERWKYKHSYDYLTYLSISSVSKNNLYKNWNACPKRTILLDQHEVSNMQKISCSFNLN